MYLPILFISSVTDGHLGCFQIFSYYRKCYSKYTFMCLLMNIWKRFSMYIPSSWNFEMHMCISLTSLSNATFLFKAVMAVCTPKERNHHLVSSDSLIFANIICVKWYLVWFWFACMTTNDFENILLCLLTLPIYFSNTFSKMSLLFIIDL